MINIDIKKAAAKDIKKINEPFKTHIKARILDLKDYPNVVNIKQLKNFNPTHRLRIGDYRVLFDVDIEKILLLLAELNTEARHTIAKIKTAHFANTL